MRRLFLRELVSLAEKDDRILFLALDLGYTVVEPFAADYPDRFLNTGVCEQNGAGIATGLAESGYIPFLYSIAPFATARPYEFIRNGAALHKLPVRMVGVGGGFEYGHGGPTHHGWDDVGLMRMLPGMTVLAPADGPQACACLRATWDLPGPVYYRLGKDDKYEAPGLQGRFNIDGVETIGDGKDVCILALGASLRQALEASKLIQAKNIGTTIVSVPCVSPLPSAAIGKLVGAASLAVTVEAHVESGGLGEAVSSVIAQHGLATRLLSCCARGPWDGYCGSESYYLEKHGLDARAIADRTLEALESSTP
ncbi:transketolase family protein [Verrucomicrobiota bacterium]